MFGIDNTLRYYTWAFVSKWTSMEIEPDIGIYRLLQFMQPEQIKMFYGISVYSFHFHIQPVCHEVIVLKEMLNIFVQIYNSKVQKITRCLYLTNNH